MSELDRTRLNWERFGQTDPLTAILNDRAEWDVDAFFESGREELARELRHLSQIGVVAGRGRALDFGCGIGRLTQALCSEFEECDGVDVAASMVERARTLNRFGERCRYHANPNADLTLFADESFDFVLSIIVLQHVPPDVALNYVSEFVRVLRPGGVADFQVPAQRRAERTTLDPGGFQAEIVPLDPPAELAAGARAAVRVRIRNTSTETWRRGMYLRLVDRWYRGGRPWTLEDARVELPGPIEPGSDASVSITVRAPRRPGSYELEFDVLQEGVSSFSERGSKVARVPLRIRASRATVGALARRVPGGKRLLSLRRRLQPAPEMDMNCIPTATVVSRAEAAGGRVVDVSELDVCGEDYESYRYVVLKPA